MRTVVIVSAVRTPFGRLGGALQSFSAVQLGAWVMKEALRRISLPPEQVDEVIFGNVISGGLGQIPARQAAVKAHIPVEVPALSINKVCASGLRAITLAHDIIAAGQGDILLAGGMESMSQVPFYALENRFPPPLGHRNLQDGLLVDGLVCPFEGVHMGVLGERLAREFSISREEQDEWALRSHERAVKAIDEGWLKEEILPLSIPGKKGPGTLLKEDESPRRDTSLQSLSRLQGVFVKGGSITPGNAPGINDGAAALVLMAQEKAQELGIEPLARITDYSMVAANPQEIARVPALAAQKLLKKTHTPLQDIQRIEVNEAFAAVALITNQMMGWEVEKVNVNGGAIAFGHPIGVSGARIVMTLIYQLRQAGLSTGLATICSGTAQGDAILITV